MTKYLTSALVTATVITMVFIACSKSSEDQQGGGGNTCDTTAVKYSTDIVPILQNNCYGCHGAGSTGGSGGIDLSAYSKLKVYADNGYLVGNVTHAQGFVGMPFGQPKMADCPINKISAWVHQGAKDN